MKTASELEAFILEQIPLARAMSLQVNQFNPELPELVMSCPLEPNRNDKGTGFAGSIASCATLAGWGLTTLLAAQSNIEATVVIASSQIEYHKPVTADFYTVAELATDETIERFNRDLKQRGKSRLQINVRVMQGNKQVARLEGLYAAKSKSLS